MIAIGEGVVKVGMLWFDNDKARTLGQKVWRAANRYHVKVGRWPDTVYANPLTIGEQVVEGIEVKRSDLISPDNFWIGEAEQETED